jgi:hypothetical protein
MGTIFSSEYKKKMGRLKDLPRMSNLALLGARKKDIMEINKIFQEGISKNKFNLEKLAHVTILNKTKKGYDRPRTPLYGKGEKSKDSFMNMMLIRKLKNGWKLYPSWRKHWSGNIKLVDLFKIHERGAKIKRGNGITQIPPRPALRMAYRAFQSLEKRRADNFKTKIKEAIRAYINKGDKSKLNKLIKLMDEKLY